MRKRKWNLESMRQYCIDNNFDYQVLDTKWIDKGYQKQLWACVKCPNKNHSPYWVWWNSFVTGGRCKQCHYEICNFEFWDSEKAFEFVKQNGYVMLDKNDFKNVDKPFPCYDDKGFIYMVTISNLKHILKGNRCSFSIIKKNPYAMYNIKHYCDLYRKDYEIVSTKYKGVKEKHIFRYLGEFDDGLEHCREFECTIDCFINGNVKHPFLTRSNGERIAEEYFKTNNITYYAEKTFPDCKDKQVLPYDFYLPDYKIILEIMGKQHEEPVEFFGGEKQFEIRQKHDKIKKDYAINNGYKFLEIWYYDFDNIEEILNRELEVG